MWIEEAEFAERLRKAVSGFTFDAVTGPGRSGAVAAVYASYASHRPFVPFGQPYPGVVLVIDTVCRSGKTLRKAVRRLERLGIETISLSVYGSPPERHHFWYERG